MNLGESIRRAREMRDWTQDELATAVGVSTMTIRNWESGRHTPKNALARVEEVLGIDADDPTLDHGPTIAKASDAELIGELISRLHDRTSRIAELQREVADHQSGRVLNVNGGRWAARLRGTDGQATPGGGSGDDAGPAPDQG